MPDPASLFPVVRSHLEALSDDIGIMQHAVGPEPDPRHGYCTDDVARAILVDLAQADELGWPAVAASVGRGLTFLEAAFEPSSGQFRNLRDAAGAWLPVPTSEDAHARAVHALGELLARVRDADVRRRATALFERSLPAAAALRWMRPQAAALLGCAAARRAGLDGTARTTHGRLASALMAAVGPTPADSSWPWPEASLTYENGLVAEALIVAGARLDDQAMVERGRSLVDWLGAVQTAPEGHLSLVGNRGWWRRGGPRAGYDQQAIDATALLLAADAARVVSGEPRYEALMERCYGWFLGRNDGGVALAIPDRGACQDGLTPSGPNRNQGAESTLMWSLALEATRRMRRTRGARIGDAVGMVTPA